MSKSDLSQVHQQHMSKSSVQLNSAKAAQDEGEVPDDATVLTLDTAHGMVRRDIWAPPGKLGVSMDWTPKGPMVHEVHSTPFEMLTTALWSGWSFGVLSHLSNLSPHFTPPAGQGRKPP